MKPGRSTTTRDRHRAIIKRDRPPCGICQQPIDYDLPYLHPGSFVVDHVIPVALGGEDELANKRAAHRHPVMQPHQRRQARRRVRHASSQASRGPARDVTVVVSTRTRGASDVRRGPAPQGICGFLSPSPNNRPLEPSYGHS